MNIGFTMWGDLDKDVINWAKQFTIPPSGMYLYNLSSFIKSLKSDRSWYKYDRFWIYATEQQEHARLDIKNLSTLSEINSPTWTILQGYTGAAGKYLNSNFNPTINAINYSRNSASYGFYSRSNTSGTKVDMGAINNAGNGNGNFTNIRSSGGTLNFSINCTVSVGGANSDSRGFYSFNRPDSTTQQSYKDGLLFQEATAANSTALLNLNFYILCWNFNNTPQNYTDRQISMSYMSGALTQDEILNLSNSFKIFATKQGFSIN